MKNIILAAGYATRLYPLTENFPKPLLEIGGSTILGRILSDVDTFPEIDEHIIVTNHKFADIFDNWATKQILTKKITIIDDDTSTNDTRLGAVRDLLLAINKCNIDDDIMVLAADNILNFSFRGFVDAFKQNGTSMIMCHNEPELKKLQRTGVILVDKNMKVLEMQEKPEKPASNWAVPPFYIYRREDMPLIKDCMNHGCKFDAPGNLAHYLCEIVEMHAWQMSGNRFDIGSLDFYEEAKRIYNEK
jgi:glucose-1-phosphate thymidylyltransferase